MKKLFFKFSQHGFSLVEALVAVGLLGGIALVVVKQSEQAGLNESQLNATQEVNAIVNQISTILAQKNNCTATVKGKGVNDSLDAIYRGDDPTTQGFRDSVAAQKTGREVFKLHEPLSSRRLLISEMRLVQKQAPSGDDLGDFLRLKFISELHPDMIKDFQIIGDKDSSGKFISCHSVMFNEIEEGIAQTCGSIGGEWDEVNKKCELVSLPGCFLTDQPSCGTSGTNDSRLYVAAGQMEFTQYDYTVCRTNYKLLKFPVECRFPPHANAANPPEDKCKCQPYGCTCLADPITCRGRWLSGCHLEFKPKYLTKCCRPGGTP
jgi:type II secretory pathway pseudopilin PulG